MRRLASWGLLAGIVAAVVVYRERSIAASEAALDARRAARTNGRADTAG